ncbi:HSF-type DNA-binding domain containing protein [Coccidioides posadasii C735 delta SOWgp]|uniref:HSF-type DNA-binding domain containing protein n=1 Tax=Coccidioides posadasii (strain C735) TaxID=222929 RepID=C5P817_COCP7|nr:HSF-type DNA-binding domain containing protein [Coccidioides posadasii C735 delta SOWgp]EER27567.1 HSF-type DNA-binding domain containing protein [Coccidioides posadasii C735 delta SOWgp]|eukprot:XP_003069712.1 HSF-type DNA-binding domain containing protein [Coccidioides posadasii C735 delta SOWgp]
MTSQGSSRKRPAPGTVPISQHPIASSHNYPVSDSQLSNDQFLQWGQAGPPLVNPPGNSPIDPYQSVPHPADMGSIQAASQQLTRRPGNQLIGRPRKNEQGVMTLMEPPPRPGEVIDPATGETEEQLEQRALAAKKEAQAKRKQIPPFVQKLRSFLDESKNTDLIRWSEDGRSFIVLDEDQFARTLIPELFKHSNYASFVRQLNMYGFHKKVGLSDNSMRASERKNKSPSEYSNPYFRRGHPDLLWLIQKPKNVSQSKAAAKGPSRMKTEGEGDDGENEEYVEDGGSREDRSRFRGQLSISPGDAALAKEQFANVYRELQNIRHQQQVISNTISKLRREHEQLYDQALNFQEQHNRHENSINAILTFLATVYNRSLQGHDGAQGMINSFAAGTMPQEQGQGNIIDVGDYLGNVESNLNPAQRPTKKQPLLLKAPPAGGQEPSPSRASTSSPANNQYDIQQSTNNGHGHRPSTRAGSVEELFESVSPQHTGQPPHQQPYTPVSHARSPSDAKYPPQRDIMSLIQSSNARSNMQPGAADFPSVLSSLENAGGHVPLTATQRADMLRLIANESHASDPSAISSPNNALITPNPPPMPHSYSTRLANTRAEIDNLVKMQAEQDRNVPPPTLDLDQIFHSGDYFSDYANMEPIKGGMASGYGSNQGAQTNTQDDHNNENSGDSLVAQAHDLFDFDKLQSDHVGELFADGNTDPKQAQTNSFFDAYGSGNDGGNLHQTGAGDLSGNGGNRITETFTSSEATSPANTSVDENLQALDNSNGSSFGARSPVKKRKRAQ